MENQETFDNLELLKDTLLKRIMKNDTPRIIKDGDKYDVTVQNMRFSCRYTDEQMGSIASQCLELIKELKRINDGGYTREDLEEAIAEDEEGIFQAVQAYNTFCTDRMEEIVSRLGEVTGEGGAYYMLMSKPGFIQGIYVVFYASIDRMDDIQTIFDSLYMLIRLAMRMHSEDQGGQSE